VLENKGHLTTEERNEAGNAKVASELQQKKLLNGRKIDGMSPEGVDSLLVWGQRR
jgi:hypothetical protein